MLLQRTLTPEPMQAQPGSRGHHAGFKSYKTYIGGFGGGSYFWPDCGHREVANSAHSTANDKDGTKPAERARLVEKRRDLRDLPAQFSGLERRRHRRPERNHQPARLPERAGS